MRNEPRYKNKEILKNIMTWGKDKNEMNIVTKEQ